jgi:hypothetical protein
MPHYFHSCKTSGHGLAGLIFAVPIVAMAIYGWTIADGVGRGMVALIGLGGAAILLMCVWHLFRPKMAFIEISETHLVWKDWQGFGMREWSFPLGTITSIREGSTDDTGEYLVLKSGCSMRLPELIIPDSSAFFQALQKAAPHIQIDIKKYRRAGR